MKKLLYLEDLYNFYVSQNKNVKFSSKDDNTTIVVHVDEPFTYSESKDDELNMYCPIRLCHTLTNRNKSHISEKAMEDAIPTAYNMPILGYVYKDDGDEYQFAGHEFFVDNNNELVYEESPCGVIPESAGLKLVKYDGDDRLYLEGTGIIWRTYSKASDIIEREKELNVSVELMVDELSFDSKNKELVIDKFRFSGVTILGKDRNTGAEIQPGMENSVISIADFSEKNNSVFSNNKVIELLSALNEKLDNLNIDQNLRKEETMKKEFDEQTEVEIKDSPSAEVFDGEDPEGVDYYDEPGEEETEEEPEEQTEQEVVEEETLEPTRDASVVEEEDSSDNELTIPLGQRDDDDTASGSKKYSIECTVEFDGIKKSFSTIRDQLVALTTLVNETYGEADYCFYDCDADPETKTVYMHDYWNDKHYRQTYSVKKDVYALKGDRIEIFCTYLSADELKQFENMKANYSSIQDELAQYKAEPEKLAVLADECYSQIVDTEGYKKLSERDIYFSMSVDEVRAELDKQLLEFAKGHKVEFSAKDSEKKNVGMKIFKNPSEKKTKGTSRYGGIFSK